ncbi:MAG: RHS repeat-associated core domain-containing protein [Phycisphaerae bacterium]
MPTSTTPAAGGIGGLLAVLDWTLVTPQMSGLGQAYLYDGNGNVGQLISLDDGSVVTAYEYDAYGNITAETDGEYAPENPFRFSTKFHDDETGWVYYGYRFYGPKWGRWAGRDPIGENGGLNILEFIGNRTTYAVDAFGLDVWRRDRRRRSDTELRADCRPQNRPRSRETGGDFASDWAGRQILDWYLTGGGVDHVISNDPQWTQYLMVDPDLADAVQAVLLQRIASLCARPGESAEDKFDVRIAAEMQNGESITGYNYLHGTNRQVGGLHVTGVLTKRGCCCVQFRVNVTWNDIIDPNGSYATDIIKNAIAETVTLGEAEPYTLKINFSSSGSYTRCPCRFNGWPFDTSSNGANGPSPEPK